MGIVLVLIGQAIQQDAVTPNSRCGVGPVSNSTILHCRFYNSTTESAPDSPMDFTNPLLLYLVVGVLALFAMAALFRPKYKRLEMESRAALLAKLQHDEVTPASSVASLPPHTGGKTAAAQGHFKMGASQGQTHLTSTEL